MSEGCLCRGTADVCVDVHISVAAPTRPCTLTLPLGSFQEDPRLKYPIHMRTKASLDPGDLGPLPVSMDLEYGLLASALAQHLNATL